MKKRRQRIILGLLVLIFCCLGGASIIYTWKGFYPYHPPFSAAGLFSAIYNDPTNPDPYYRLGLFYQWDIRHFHLEKAIHYLKEAIKRNPLEPEYWLNLAQAFQKQDDYPLAEEALRMALMVSPTSYRSRWIGGNLFLQKGDYDQALPYFSFILKNYPAQSRSVYEVWEKAGGDRYFILQKLIPDDPLALSQFLSYLGEVGDGELAWRTWQKRNSLGYKPSPPETLQFVEFLIAQRLIIEGFQIFQDLRHQEGLAPSAPNLVTNGGFEEEKFLNKGFDWRLNQGINFNIVFDESIFYSGRKSLKITFLGKENLHFHHVFQYVPLKPNQDYLLRAFLKTEALTTQSGLKLEVASINGSFYKQSATLIGSNDWREVSISFRTPPDLQGGLIRFRRDQTDKFDRFISGKVWVDNVRLEEKGPFKNSVKKTLAVNKE